MFYLHHLKVRSEPSIYLQEALTVFVTNFIRWTAVWIRQQAQPDPNPLQIEKMSIKRQVQVASARVIQDSKGLLVRFSPTSSLAGKTVYVRAPQSSIRPSFLGPFFTILALIVQKLR